MESDMAGSWREWAGKFWREWLRGLLVLLLVMGAFRSAVADWNDVPSGSMKPTILEGDRIVVNRLAYDLKVPFTTWRLARWATPQRGDVVVLDSPADGKRLVKRVVGLPGDLLELRDNRLFVNGEPARVELLSRDRAQADQPARLVARERLDTLDHRIQITPSELAPRSFGPLRVPERHYFVMGDNRDQSADSRYFGFVEGNAILGRVTGVAASLDLAHHWRPRWERFCRGLH
jgi:signal peptidase I